MKTPAPRPKRPPPRDPPAKIEVPPFELTEQSFRLGNGDEHDDLREELGEVFVQTITSGQHAAEDLRDQPVTEEGGGPFVITTGGTEFANGTDASNPAGAERAAFPVVSAQPERRKRLRR